MEYYYWQYTAHPDSSFTFCHDGVTYAPDGRAAYLRSETKIKETPDYAYNLGVHLVLPIGKLVAETFDGDEEPAGTQVLANQSIQRACREAVTDEMLRTLGEKQEQQKDVYPRHQRQDISWPHSS